MLDVLFDASDRPEGDGVALWCNDLVVDARYARWGAPLGALREIMLYPGQLPSLRLNLFTVVLVLDLSAPNSLMFVPNAVVPAAETGDGDGECA